MYGMWGIPPDSFIVGRTDGNSIENLSPGLFFLLYISMIVDFIGWED